jgi:hypothetical protein
VLPSTPADALADDDLHLALYVCYELHYQGWAGVDAGWEWEPNLLAARAALEKVFLGGLRDEVEIPDASTPAAVVAALREIIDSGDGPSVSAFVADHGDIGHLQELAIHRSPYQLKEADPHTWAIPRLDGRAKAALVRIQVDEYGDGVAGHMHSALFADTMRALGLNPAYGYYLDLVPGIVLATVNLLSMFGLHRNLVGACVGHLAVFEMTSVVPMGRYAGAMRRVTGGDEGAEFYDVHVVADALHQDIAIDTLVPGLLGDDPALGADVLFGAASLMLLEGRVASYLISAWERGRSSLRDAPLAQAS